MSNVQDFNPKVSIIIPVYNGANYLREAIESCLSQTYKNLEIIVINDGSIDNGKTEEIALSYGEKIRYFSKQNGGVATALNLGIEKMTGEYFSWLSHDDCYCENKIQEQVNYLTQNTEKNAIIYSNFIVKNYFNDIEYIEEIKNFCEIKLINDLLLLFNSKINFCSLLLPLSLFDTIGYFNPQKKTTQDYDFLFRAIKAGFHFERINTPLMISRHHIEQGTHSLLDIHLLEIDELYSWAIDLFLDSFKSMSLDSLEQFNSIINQRCLSRTKNKIQAIMKYNKNLPHLLNGNINTIWMYWENKDGCSTPEYINLCIDTVRYHNNNFFNVIVLNNDDIEIFLPKINPNYKLFNKIAHKADYFRFLLLEKYGGIWLDADNIVLKNFTNIINKVNSFGFCYTGYYNLEDNKIFPIISFLASARLNIISSIMVKKIEQFIEEKLILGIQPKWDEIGGYYLQEILDSAKYMCFCFDLQCFYQIPVHYDPSLLLNSDISFNFNLSYAQALANSVVGHTLNQFGKDIVDSGGLIGNLFAMGLYGLNKYETKTELKENIHADNYQQLITVNHIKESYKIVNRLSSMQLFRMMYFYVARPTYRILRRIKHYVKR